MAWIRINGEDYEEWEVAPREWEQREYQSSRDTWLAGQLRHKRRPCDFQRRWTTALRAAASFWHGSLSDASRLQWKISSETHDAQRPNQKDTSDNGWSHFAEVALGPLLENGSPLLYANTDLVFQPTSVTFDNAEAANQQLHFTANFDVYNPPMATCGALVFQIRPAAIGAAWQTRATRFAGLYKYVQSSTYQQSFVVAAPFLFLTGQQVAVLVRTHVCRNGVANEVIERTAV